MRRLTRPKTKDPTIDTSDATSFDVKSTDKRTKSVEKEIDQLSNQLPFGLHQLDKDGIYLSVNARELSWLGYIQQELVRKVHFVTLLTIDSRKQYEANLLGLSLSSDSLDQEVSIYCKSGDITTFTLHMKAVFDGDGNKLTYQCTLFTNLDRNHTEQQLRIAATAFQSIDGMMVTNEKGIILSVNRAFTDITGFEAGDVIGKRPNVLSSGRQDEDFYSYMWAELNHKGFWKGEIWNKRKDGVVYPERLSITAVRTSGGVLTNYVATFSDITSSKRDADKIEHLVFYDPLTNLPNRRLLTERMNHVAASCQRSHHYAAVLYLDLDDFKDVNNTLGHEAGDKLLIQVAERLALCIREEDFVARLGGDEFVIILENLSQHKPSAAIQVEVVCQKILSTLDKTYSIDQHEVLCSASIGTVLLNNGDETIENLLKHADIAMYQVKKASRNGMLFFDPEMQNIINVRSRLIRDLKTAIEKNQFQLYYQLQVNDSGHPEGAEGLIRWLHPEHGLILPPQFIPIAEESNVILLIGQWVLETACTQIKKWQLKPPTCDLVLCINVSAKQIKQKNFVEQIQTLIHQYDINPQKLKLEITESVLLENVEDTIVKISALQRLGIRFCLDDFGTGYSSLQYLKRLPLEQLKIDQSFVRNIKTDNNDQIIVSTILAMATNLGLNVIAEGVESIDQQNILLEKGCKHYQGHLFGEPLPLKDFEGLLNTYSN